MVAGKTIAFSLIISLVCFFPFLIKGLMLKLSDDSTICQGDGTDMLNFSLNCIWLIPLAFAIGMTLTECLTRPGSNHDEEFQKP